MALKRTITLGVSLFLSFISACGVGGTNMKAAQFFEPNMQSLLKSIQQNDPFTAKNLIAEGVNLNTLGREGITPLLWLIIQKDKKAVQLALDLGANPNFKDGDDENAVSVVAGSDDPEWLNMVLAAGGDPNSIDSEGQPALFNAMSAEGRDNIKILLKYGADVNLTDNIGRNSALYPSYIMKYELAYYFIEQGADAHIYANTGANLAWKVDDKLSKGIIAPDSINYPWAMKIKQHLIAQGVVFPPPSPADVRAMWEENGKSPQ